MNGKQYKADHTGYKALAEVLVSQLLKRSSVPNFVEYKLVLIQYQGKEIPDCASKDFRRKDEILVPLERLRYAYKGRSLAIALGEINEPQERIRYTVDFIEQTTGLIDIGAYLILLLELDAFSLGGDQHTNNLAVIRDKKTKKFRLCPTFDDGLTLLSDINDYPLDKDIYGYIRCVQAESSDLDFDMRVETAEGLHGMQLKLSFSRKEISEELKFVIKLYDEEIYRRVEQVLFEQMRKYQIYF